MGLIFRLSFRNLLRQKRRNLLLGIGIGFGMMILIIANSFSNGMVDVLVEDLVVHAYGHLVIDSKPGNNPYQIFNDGQQVIGIIKNNIKKDDLFNVDEQLQMYGQAIGNGATDNIMVVGAAISGEKERKVFDGFFNKVQGNIDDFFSKEIEYPVIISDQEAETLNVKLHDAIRVRLPMVTGQMQAAKLTVIAIATPNNSLMNMAFFLEADRVKKLLGYKPWEAGQLKITLTHPLRTVNEYADILHKQLTPQPLSITGKINGQDCRIIAFNNDDESKKLLRTKIRIISGDQSKAFAKGGVMVSDQLARQFNLQVGSTFIYQYQTKFKGPYQEKFTVNAIYGSNTKLGSNVVLVNGERIFDTYNRYLPANRNFNYISKDDSLYPVLATEWKLLPRSKNSEELQQRYNEQRNIKTDQVVMNVTTMYEGADFVLKMENALGLITFIAVLILFFIILIGVMNTLRMTIRERTREIGTMRAIGMQKKDVRNEFILETLMLTTISCIAGIIAGVIVMQILGAIELRIANAISMILRNNHLLFKLSLSGILKYFIFILIITTMTAYFPARRAARLSAVESLRHYE